MYKKSKKIKNKKPNIKKIIKFKDVMDTFEKEQLKKVREVLTIFRFQTPIKKFQMILK